MAQTLSIPAPTTAAAVSSDIVVGATPVSIFAYTSTGLFPARIQLFLDRKIGAGWQLEATLAGLSISANSPGTYRLRKGVTPYAVGFGKDEV